jgi:hypothetical protein
MECQQVNIVFVSSRDFQKSDNDDEHEVEVAEIEMRRISREELITRYQVCSMIVSSTDNDLFMFVVFYFSGSRKRTRSIERH